MICRKGVLVRTGTGKNGQEESEESSNSDRKLEETTEQVRREP